MKIGSLLCFSLASFIAIDAASLATTSISEPEKNLVNSELL